MRSEVAFSPRAFASATALLSAVLYPAAFVNPTEAATGPAQTPTLLTFTFSGKGLKPLDAINILITPSDNANDDLYLHGLTLRYLRHSSLRYLDDRHD